MIYADSREKQSGIPYELEKNGIIVIMDKLLPIGDYIVRGVIDVCVEVKTAIDFAKSIIDGRYNNQCYNMSTNFSLSFYYIRGSVHEASFTAGLPVQTIIHAMHGVSLRRSPHEKSGFIINVPVELKKDIVTSLIYLDNQLQEEQNLLRLYHIEKKSIEIGMDASVIGIISSYPMIGEKKAKSLIEYFGTLNNFNNSDYDELIQVKGIGKKLAQSIIDIREYRIGLR